MHIILQGGTNTRADLAQAYLSFLALTSAPAPVTSDAYRRTEYRRTLTTLTYDYDFFCIAHIVSQHAICLFWTVQNQLLQTRCLLLPVEL